MDLAKIVSDLEKERDRLTRAIGALVESVFSPDGRKPVGRPKGSTTKRKKRSGLTPEGRRRLSLAMKKRWAERRGKDLSAKTAAPKKRGRLTPAGRKRLSEAMKKRWAERKAKAS